jgi:autotransporter-associated beta strand protein
MNKSTIAKFMAISVAAHLSVASAHATALTIQNYSFENTANSGPLNNVWQTVHYGNAGMSIDAWTTVMTGSGANGTYLVNTPTGFPDGVQALTATMWYGTSTATTTYSGASIGMFSPGCSYTLKMAVAETNHLPGNFTLNLLDNGSVIATRTVSLNGAGWQDLTVTASSGYTVGDQIGISFVFDNTGAGSGTQFNADNVRLDVSIPQIWDAGVNSNWDTTTANWSGTVWTNGTSAAFGATGVGSVNLGPGITADSLTFDTAGYTLAGGTLGLSGTSAITANADVTITSALAGSQGLAVYGTATLTLAGSNTYSGATTVNQGTLAIGGAPGTASLAVAPGAALAVAGTGTVGQLTLAGTLAMAAGSYLNLDLGGSGAGDCIHLTGSYVAPAGAVKINVNALAGFGAGTYTVLTGASGLSASSFVINSTPQGYACVLAANNGTLTLTCFESVPIRILPLGDSITYGAGGDANLGGYRSPLYTALTAAGYQVNFIGTSTENSSLMEQPHHEGHPGWVISQIASNISGWLATVDNPDVVLLHIGTNDIGSDFANAINRLDDLITQIATLRPYAHIIVTNLMERFGDTQIPTLFNPYVQAKVDAQAALGRRVTFLDMHAAVPLANMPDGLHPNQTGYNLMANAWLPAIQAVCGPLGDAAAPGIAGAAGAADRTHVAVTFSKPVTDAAATVANFALSGGLSISSAVLDASRRVVTLTTSAQTGGTTYTVTVNGVVDRTAAANPLPANSTATFQPALVRGYANNVPESAAYSLVYSLDIADASIFNAAVPYAVDNHASAGPFSRVAYYLELEAPGGTLQYVWASMNAFTTDAGKIGVPSTASGAVFQQPVSGMNVVSNSAGVVTGTGLTGNLEFWPTNYATNNGAGVVGASDATFDFGDTRLDSGSYGSMQLHNPAAAQTVFAFNNWGGSGSTGDLGIGNFAGTNPDWTFANNANGYSIKTLQVLILPQAAAPADLSATAGNGQVALAWSASPGATGYNVKRSTVNGSGYVTIVSNTTATSYIDSSAANWTTYYYVVSAVNAGGEGANSAQASAQPQSPPISATEVAASSTISISGNTASLAFAASVVGHTYQLQTSESLATGTWTDYGPPQAGSGAALVFALPYDPSAPKRFYRVQIRQ